MFLINSKTLADLVKDFSHDCPELLGLQIATVIVIIGIK